MTTYTVQKQSQRSQQFNVELDGASYLAIIYWLAFGQRYYIRILDNSNQTVLNLPLISSDYDVNIVAGYFSDSSLTYHADDSLMVVLP